MVIHNEFDKESYIRITSNCIGTTIVSSCRDRAYDNGGYSDYLICSTVHICNFDLLYVCISLPMFCKQILLYYVNTHPHNLGIDCSYPRSSVCQHNAVHPSGRYAVAVLFDRVHVNESRLTFAWRKKRRMKMDPETPEKSINIHNNPQR